ncbi:MAG: thioredoxin domain-containing protein [Methanomicrobiaceae archaeon]|nr:thioredoxin domain-containing protein [Methanomicrobiaceae archaeon]
MNPARGERDQAASGSESGRPNRLIHEKSPYLLQHARNPVDWHPWGEEAFARARQDDKPVFLSIGYSTCHWCHVMAHESFEDPGVAKLLNETFVCIKVDREERPDIDQTYIAAAQLITGRAGWPLTLLLTPDRKPFFAATYIPRTGRYGMTGMLELIPRVRKIWRESREELEESGSRVLSVLEQSRTPAPGEGLDEGFLRGVYEELRVNFDGIHGGFGEAPKFPVPHTLSFLLRYGSRTGEAAPQNFVEKTLRAMRRGGIYDHIGFGFHRYSTDAAWKVPHFEKMLYDQALLAMAYTEAFLVAGKEEYRRTVQEILAYVLRDMTDREGGFYSAEDADSEGEEGKYYLWTTDEIRDVLGEEDGRRFIRVFGLTEEGNCEREATGERTGRNILFLDRQPAVYARELGISEDGFLVFLQSARERLHARREERIRPQKDDKVLADWNGLMIAALAKASRALDAPIYREAAERAADFILSRMRREDGRLLHRYRDGEAAVTATADDYAFLCWGLIELYEASFAVRHLTAARDLMAAMIRHYRDPEDGGFYFMPDDAEDVLVRQKVSADGSMPSANSIAMLNLLRLARMTANPAFEEMAGQIPRTFTSPARSFPSAHTSLATALDFALGPSCEVVIAGMPGAADTRAMLQALRTAFIPNTVLLFRPADQDPPEIAGVAGFLQDMEPIEGRATAYVCTGYTCNVPTTDPGEMMALLGAETRRRYPAEIEPL